jgi:hypothetical protein
MAEFDAIVAFFGHHANIAGIDRVCDQGVTSCGASEVGIDVTGNNEWTYF